MGRNLRYTDIESWSIYLTWIIYIIGTVQIKLLLVIQNECIICDFTWYIWDKDWETGEGSVE